MAVSESGLLPIYATATLTSGDGVAPPEDLARILSGVVPAQTDADALRALSDIGANSAEYGRGAVSMARGGGFAYVLRRHGQDVHILSCSTLPACSSMVLLDDALRRAKEAATALGSEWKWSVALSEARGNRILTAHPTPGWWSTGGLRSPLAELLVAAATVIGSLVVDKAGGTHLVPGAGVLLAATVLRLVVARLLARPDTKTYVVTDG